MENVTDVILLYNITADYEILGPKRDSLSIIIPITIIYALIFITGVVGNVSTCIVIAKNRSMHTATNYYLFSLAISDLLLLVSGLPQEVYSIWSRYPYVFGYTFCILRGLFSETSANATVLTITAFTIERYVAICHPFLSHTMSKLSRAIKFIFLIWIFSITFAIPQALQFGLTPLIIGDSSTLMCHVINPIKHSFEAATFMFFVAPMSLISVLYALIGLRLRRTSIIKRNRKDQTKYARKNCKSDHTSRRVLRMLVAVVIAFFVCWAPFHAQRLVAIYVTLPTDGTNHERYLKIYEIVTYISGIFYYVSTTINPILYNLLSNKFREAFKETFTRCCCCESFPTLQSSESKRAYSVLSRSIQRGPDSVESSCMQSHSAQGKTSTDSIGTNPDKRCDKLEMMHAKINPGSSFQIEENNPIDTRLVTVYYPVSDNKITTFCKKLICISQKSPSVHLRINVNKESSSNRLSLSFCDISNSSLKDVECGALEDELKNYSLQF